MFNYCEEGMSFVASGDLSGLQGRIVDVLGTAPRVGHGLIYGGFGVLANKPRALEHASVVTDGVVKTKAGGTVSPGNYIYCSGSGWAAVHTPPAVNVASGTVLRPVVLLGRALTAAASGFDFALKFDRQTTFVASA